LRLFLILLATILSACSTRSDAFLGSVELTPNAAIEIPSGSKLGYPVSARQLITAHFRGRSQVFEAYVSVTPDKILMIGFGPLGNRLLTVTATDRGINSELAPSVPAFFRPEIMLADFVIVYWPASEVRRGLKGSEASLHDSPKERRIEIAGNELVRVTYDSPHGDRWPELAHLENFTYGYELDLQSKVIGH